MTARTDSPDCWKDHGLSSGVHHLAEGTGGSPAYPPTSLASRTAQARRLCCQPPTPQHSHEASAHGRTTRGILSLEGPRALLRRSPPCGGHRRVPRLPPTDAPNVLHARPRLWHLLGNGGWHGLAASHGPNFTSASDELEITGNFEIWPNK